MKGLIFGFDFLKIKQSIETFGSKCFWVVESRS
jgi:hypothetical protein